MTDEKNMLKNMQREAHKRLKMEAVKLDTLEKIAKGMAQELSIGSNTTDKYKLKDKVVYLHRDVKTKEIYIVDAATIK